MGDILNGELISDVEFECECGKGIIRVKQFSFETIGGHRSADRYVITPCRFCNGQIDNYGNDFSKIR